MSNVIFNNFTAGLVTQKLAGNYNSNAYHSGCAVLENFSVMLQGGITRRPPLVSEFEENGVVRAIPFIIDADTSYMVLLGYTTSNNVTTGWFKLKQKVSGSWNTIATGSSPYTTKAELDSVQFAQSADTLFLAQEDHRPQKFFYDASAQPAAWKMANLEARMTRYQDESGTWMTYDPLEEPKDSNGYIFKSAGNYPSVVGLLHNRLWLCASKNNVNRYWVSKPYYFEKFEYYEMVTVVDDQLTAENIVEVISTDEYSTEKTYSLGETIQRNGYIYECIVAISTPEEWTSAHWQVIGSAELPSSVRFKYEPTVTEENGMRFDASGNDRICWLSAKSNIIIGTGSGEYVIPGQANGINYKLEDLSSYGAKRGPQAVQANSEVLYIQTGGNKLRSVTVGADGFTNLDLTYQCDRILAEHGGAVRMAWRRVPDPTLYVVCADGTMAVLFYDRMYGLCAWAHWFFNEPAADEGLALVKDICVLDTAAGQAVYLVVDRDGDLSIESIMELDASESLNTSYKDLGSIGYQSLMVSNPYEYNSSTYGSSLGKKKRIRAIRCRVYRTKGFEAGYDEKYMKSFSGSEGLNDVEVLLPGGYENFVQMTVRSVEDKPLTLLAFSLDMEAER